MTTPTAVVSVWFGTTPMAVGLFQLDGSELDGTDELASGAVSVGTDTNLVRIRRGKSSQVFDEYDASTGLIQMNNEDRLYDPTYAAGTYYGYVKPGLRIEVVVSGVTIFAGRVSDWDFDYEVGGRSIALARIEDGLALLGRQQFTDWTATGSQTAGTRLAAVLDRSEVAWPAGSRDLDTGISVLQGDAVSWGSSVLNYCQLVAKSDLGAFFISRSGAATFKDRHANLGGAGAVGFADDGSAIAYRSISLAYGSETYYNRVSVDREGGTAQTSIISSSTDDGIRSLSLSGLLLSTDAQSEDMAEFLANVYADGETRVSALTVNLDDTLMTEAEILSVLELDLTDLVTVVFTPNGVGDPIEQTCVVQGIEHEIGPAVHAVTLSLGKFYSGAFILDDALSGLLDTAGSLTF